MNLTVSELGVLLLLMFGIFHYLGILPKARSVMALFGACAVGLTGIVGHFAAMIAGLAQHWVGSVTSWAFGTALSAGLFIALAVLLIHDLHPKKGARGRTGFVALAVGILLVAGVSQLPFLAPVVSGIRSILGGSVHFINTIH